MEVQYGGNCMTHGLIGPSMGKDGYCYCLSVLSSIRAFLELYLNVTSVVETKVCKNGLTPNRKYYIFMESGNL
jgi:hypothetical protein